MDDFHFRNLLEKFGLSWKGYKKVRKGVKKRLVRHMQKLGIKDAVTYLKLIEECPKIKNECEVLLTVSISRFFRDRKLWEVLEMEVLPDIIKNNPDFVSVWSAGCARGEEVYSFKITWDRVVKKSAIRPRIKIMATDINSQYLEKAITGEYGLSSLKEVPEEVLKTYFDLSTHKGFYRVKGFLKSDIQWMEHNILETPPACLFQLIFLRNNLLTYYENPLKKKAFNRTVDTLVPGGYLIKGAHEKIPPSGNRVLKTEYHPHVWRKL